MMKKILVTGKNGQLGNAIQQLSTEHAGWQFTFVDHEDLDLSDNQAIESYFQNKQFDVIISCAAYTAVDKAESDAEVADKVNHLAVAKLAEIAKQTGTTLIQISTDYVFNGQNYRPYIETDPVEPKGVYGLTKLKGEQAMMAVNPRGCIIRTSWVYAEHGANFVKTMLRLGMERDSLNVIFDQVGSPTYAPDLAQTILTIIQQDKFAEQVEIYHYSNEGVCSWFDFATTIFELANIPCKVNPIETKDYPTPAKRPHYSLMNKAKIKQHFGIAIPYWKDSLSKCLEKLNS